jgi:hypothetical protein
MTHIEHAAPPLLQTDTVLDALWLFVVVVEVDIVTYRLSPSFTSSTNYLRFLLSSYGSLLMVQKRKSRHTNV